MRNGSFDGADLVYPLGYGWVLEAHFVGSGGRPLLERISVRSDQPEASPMGRLGSALRRVPGQAALEREARRRLIEIWHASAAGPAVVMTAGFWRDPEPPPPPRRRNTAASDLTYAKIAQAYCARVDAGSLTPIQDLVSPIHSASYIYGALHEARRRDLLTAPPRPGVAGGSLTPRARKLLGL